MLSDKYFVGQFAVNAANILDAAESAMRAGHITSDMTILIGAEGGVRLIADSDWPLDSLKAYHSADMAYRVSHQKEAIRLEGRQGSRKCFFESTPLQVVARQLLPPVPLAFDPLPQSARPALLLAETWRTLPGASD